MIEGSGETGRIGPKKTEEVNSLGVSGGKGDPNPPTPNINWAKASLDDLRMAFIVGYGPEKGQKMFNQFQLMICQTCISQMKAVQPKKHDDSQNQ